MGDLRERMTNVLVDTYHCMTESHTDVYANVDSVYFSGCRGYNYQAGECKEEDTYLCTGIVLCSLCSFLVMHPSAPKICICIARRALIRGNDAKLTGRHIVLNATHSNSSR